MLFVHSKQYGKKDWFFKNMLQYGVNNLSDHLDHRPLLAQQASTVAA